MLKRQINNRHTYLNKKIHKMFEYFMKTSFNNKKIFYSKIGKLFFCFNM